MSRTKRTLIILVSLALTASVACAGDSRTRVLRPSVRLAEPRASHSTTALGDGRLLVVGGFRKGRDGRSQVYSATTELVDPVRGVVSSGPRLRHARAGHSAVALADGRILVAGGWDGAGMVRTAEVYDPRTGAFADVGELTEARGGHAAVRLADGRVLVCGGGDGAAVRTAEIFDPADDRFHATAAMIDARIGHSATMLADGRVLVVGGTSSRDRVLATAELYDPAAGTFAAAASPAVERYKHAAIRLADGRVLIAGGADERDWTGKHDTTELYDPASDRFTAGPSLTTTRFKLQHAVVAFGDSVALAGGAGTVELVAPGRPSRAIASLGGASYFGTATVVGDRLVVIGGYDERIRAARSVWVIAPPSPASPSSRP
jgi:hypothetical protein